MGTGYDLSFSNSGIVDREARVPATDPRPVRAASLTLAGEALPLVGAARIYCCGITPYDVTHLGHASVFVWTDTLASVAHAAGVTAQVCRNVTDVDDVLTAAAGREGVPYDEFASTQEFLFDRDMAALNVQRVAHAPRARAHISHVVELAAALLRADAAYEQGGAVFLRGEQVLASSGLSPEEALARSREFGEPEDDGRRAPYDVPVWRPSGDTDPAWPSPWGWGRPGWHAECSAMAWSVFGVSVDVLVGGADLTWPHHAYQSAMVELASGTAPFARRVMHVGSVHHQGAKMAKSTGNLVLVAPLVERASGGAVRLMLLDRPWSQPWEYDDSQLDAAAARLDRLYAAAGRPPGDPDSEADAVEAVTAALLDDLDVPRALDVAEERGGAAARTALRVLRLG